LNAEIGSWSRRGTKQGVLHLPAERRYLRRHAMALTVVVLTLTAFTAGCGDDDDSGGSASPGSSVEPEPPSTQPAASDSAAVRPYIEDLLAAWDTAMTPILGDPRGVVDDPESPLRADLGESFTAESPYVEDLDLLLAGYIDQDAGLRPGPSGLVQRTTFLEFTEIPDDDQASFVVCTFTDGVDFALSTGEELPPTVGIRQVAGTAVRVDGRWLLDALQLLGFEEKPAGTPNPCPALASGEGE
jgi:hypothetical protein